MMVGSWLAWLVHECELHAMCVATRGRLTKRPKEYSPLRMPKYASALSQVCGLSRPRQTSDHENFSLCVGYSKVSVTASIKTHHSKNFEQKSYIPLVANGAMRRSMDSVVRKHPLLIGEEFCRADAVGQDKVCTDTDNDGLRRGRFSGGHILQYRQASIAILQSLSSECMAGGGSKNSQRGPR